MLLAAAMVVPLAASVPVDAPAVAEPTAAVAAPALERVQWLSDRRVALWVTSPAMGVPIQVQLLLARDWNARPEARFPVLFLLDGLRATDDENGWTKEAGAVDFFADKNVTVVLPVGGQSSFYADWLQPDNGRTYKWETFLTKELPPLLESHWRATPVRGVEGLSMGGTAAMFLAARNPGFVRHAASYSGFLTTTTLGMPQAIEFAMRDAGGFDSAAMWGPQTGPEWEAHDPYVLADKLRGISIYVSSGSGAIGPYDRALGIPGVSTNVAGMGLEILSRLTSQNFVTKLSKLAIPAQVNYRPSGTHSWPYWDFEMRQSWSQAASALGVDPGKPACQPGGAIGPVAAAAGWLGECVTEEYAVAGGTAQDFKGGRVFFTPDRGAYPVGGVFGPGYQAAGGPAGPLGLPTGEERALEDGRGRFQPFQHGSLYWTPQTGAQMVRGAILDEWGKQGFERGPAGYPTAPEAKTPSRDGAVQAFENGPFYYSQATGVHRVQGLILGKYAQLGFENSPLGFPVAEEQTVKDAGRFSRFEGGAIYWSPVSGAWAVRNGPILDAWRDAGYENGKLGFPTGDEFPISDGVQQNFQGGFITLRDGKTEVHAL
ncbi:alpha/beta hydrolase-fold protein [Nocardia implantans]|uniref:Alpha/beta hydrolase-fold protein n=1 Tax=Nocardia implantans TaxID=3108168 RepID=A0ABU6ANG4_9NOCA|nr:MULTISPECIES: alpha/beta hydrolase-fold protein [unclassified Nocardia]MBF6192171.1 esterase [Nocardia beijingensis]MEA3530304.1 alpha/beta hydrolase-fold protein [Nocardia sp. CDC192]MEB3509012.1 alpha/beta hydrolase-fold protein [Nocardia sp. CDC186]